MEVYLARFKEDLGGSFSVLLRNGNNTISVELVREKKTMKIQQRQLQVAPDRVFSAFRLLGQAPTEEMEANMQAVLKTVDPRKEDMADITIKIGAHLTGYSIPKEKLHGWIHDELTVDMDVTNCPAMDLAANNFVYVNPADFPLLKSLAGTTSRVMVSGNGIRSHYFNVQPAPQISTQNSVAFNAAQRQSTKLATDPKYGANKCSVRPYVPTKDIMIGGIHFELDLWSARTQLPRPVTLDGEKVCAAIQQLFSGQVFVPDQIIFFIFGGLQLRLVVKAIESVDVSKLQQNLGTSGGGATRGGGPRVLTVGHFTGTSEIMLTKAEKCPLGLTGGARQTPMLFREDWDFEDMGIGGLDSEFQQIFRRAFASRLYPPDVVERLGIQHVKGMLLYGPPGTGKTLMARQIGKMLNAQEIKVVNGPEILNKYVGQSEENIRKLFAEAEADYKKNKENSALHIIIFDEIDAICRQRGSRSGDSTGVGDTVVNQLLSKIDGVEALNNILVIGMTNRKDMIDPAMIRAGRLEVLVEINLPNLVGRKQILRIHTRKMREAGLMGDDVDIDSLGERSANFSGAEIESLVKSATSFALNSQIDIKNVAAAKNMDEIKVTMPHFEAALGEVKPAYGVDEDQEEHLKELTEDIIDFGERFQNVRAAGLRLALTLLAEGSRTRLNTVLIRGVPGCGKTALAAEIAKRADVPFVKICSAASMIGYSTIQKARIIQELFEDAYKSRTSVIILDDIERLFDYVPIGPRFSVELLQTISVLAKQSPPKGKRLLVIGTTQLPRSELRDLQIDSAFHEIITVPLLESEDEFTRVLKETSIFKNEADLAAAVKYMTEGMVNKASQGIPIKDLLRVTDIAKANIDEAGGFGILESFNACFEAFVR